jgi:Flp pilus assembly protein CpaB
MPPSGDLSPLADRRTRLRRAVRRTVLARRRPLAAVFAAVAVLAAIHATQAADGPTVAVPVAARDLAFGTVLGPDDVVVRRLPAGTAPRGVANRPVGRTLAAPVRAGEPVTDVRLVGPALAAAYPGRVALPVRIADGDAVGLLRVGDSIDLVAADPRTATASYVATGLPVLALPAPADREVGSSGLTGRLVVVAALPGEVDTVAGAAATDLLSVVISP